MLTLTAKHKRATMHHILGASYKGAVPIFGNLLGGIEETFQAEPDDVQGHGTFVATRQRHHLTTFDTGVSPGSTVYPIQIAIRAVRLTHFDHGRFAECARCGCRIINISYNWRLRWDSAMLLCTRLSIRIERLPRPSQWTCFYGSRQQWRFDANRSRLI